MSYVGETHLCKEKICAMLKPRKLLVNYAKILPTQELNQLSYTRLQACLRLTIETYGRFMQETKKQTNC